MRPESPLGTAHGVRGRAIPKPRIAKAKNRKADRRRVALEALEPRALMAVLPAPTVAATTKVFDRGTTGNISQPTIAIDPTNPLNIVSVYTVNDSTLNSTTPVQVRGSYSTNGGTSWSAFNPTGDRGIDSEPYTTTVPAPQFTQVTDGGVAWDRQGNFYVLQEQHAADNHAGEIVVSRYTMSGGPSFQGSKVVKDWNTSGSPSPVGTAALQPTLAVDANQASYTDPTTGLTQKDPYTANPVKDINGNLLFTAGNVYVAWVNDTPPPQSPPNPWNRYTIQMEQSIDGARTFGNFIDTATPPAPPAIVFSADTPISVGDGNSFVFSNDASPRLAISQGTADGRVKGGQVTVLYDDYGGGPNATGRPVDLIKSRTVTPGSASSSPLDASLPAATSRGTLVTVAQTTVRGPVGAAPGGANSVASPAAPQTGIGPGASVASDNTLGSFSPYQGRLYVTYVGRYNSGNPVPGTLFVGGQATNNDADNTDVFLSYSDDGGASWNPIKVTPDLNAFPLPVNDDNGSIDGYSGATPLTAGTTTGRPQFEPSVAVDRDTGILAISFYDARYDAAHARVAMTLATSLDGGTSFNNQNGAFANTPQVAFDAITQKNVTLGPIPDNQSANVDTTFGFGAHQSLAIIDGKIYPAWAGNINGDSNGQRRADLLVARATTASGPRIVAATMGPVGQPGDTVNTARAADGSPIANTFIVTFDRPVDPSTFTAADVTIQGRDPSGNLFAVQPTVTGNPVALNAGTFGPAAAAGATRFRVTFSGGTQVGTYSYSVGADIFDRVRTPSSTGYGMDQSDRARAAAAATNADKFANPRPLGGVPFAGPYDLTTLPLIVPGPHLVDTGTPVILNGAVNAVQVTFDRDIATFPASQVLSIIGPNGLIPGPYTVSPVSGNLRTFTINFPSQAVNGTYAVQLGPGITSTSGYFIDSNLNAGLDVLRGTASATGVVVTNTISSADVPKTIGAGATVDSKIVVTDPTTAPIQHLTLQLNVPDFSNDPDLTAIFKKVDPISGATLINPITGQPEQVILFGGAFPVGQTGTGTGFQNTIFDDTSATPIANGGRPFFSTFAPQQSIDLALQGISPAGTYVLQLISGTDGTGSLVNWSITYQTTTPGTGVGEPVADQSSVRFRVFNLDPTQTIASSTWTALGPAGIGAAQDQNGQTAGRVSAIAVDPSDPSGNTVYAAGASGGVWKTTNFLTTNSSGPTWVPLTDFGSDFAANIGAITVIGVNHDTRQSIIIAATGEGNAKGNTTPGNASQRPMSAQGVGFLRSMDGGLTWALLDSSNNDPSVPYIDRDHVFALGSGTSAFRVAADPKPLPGGGYIIYAALSDADGSGRAGGIWRSLDTGRTWSRMLNGQATDLVLDPNSGTGAPDGNLQTVDAALQGIGIFVSNNRAQDWRFLPGGNGNPLIRDQENVGQVPAQVGVVAPPGTPNGAKGRITLARPALVANQAQTNKLYQGYLYAAVATPDGDFDGLYVTKDFGANWTQVQLPINAVGTPTNDFSLTTRVDPADSNNRQGNFALSLAVDPNNANVIYLGSAQKAVGVLRIDTTGIADPYAFYLSNFNPGAATLETSSTGPISEQNPNVAKTQPPLYTPALSPFLNMVVDPNNPFATNATILVTNVATAPGFSNTGGNVKWIPFTEALQPNPYATDFNSTLATRVQNTILTIVDPVTGKARLIFGNNQGIYSGVDAGDGTLIGSIGGLTLGAVGGLDSGAGNTKLATGSRNGNLQIAQMYSAAAQPSTSAVLKSVATQAGLGAALYGETYEAGQPQSNPNTLNPAAAGSGYGNITWLSPVVGSGTGRIDTRLGTGSDIATDPTGSGTVYDFVWPASLIDQIQTGAGYFPFGPIGQVATTDFFQVTAQGRTSGLFASGTTWANDNGSNFTVNSIDGKQILVGARNGRVFRTENTGQFWTVSADPTDLDGTYAQALAFGAPDPNGPGGIGNLDNFLYAGTVGGRIFISQTGGGGGAANAWTEFSNGLDGSPVAQIITSPDRGSHEAYAVTSGGVSVSVPNDPPPPPPPGQPPANVITPMHPTGTETVTIGKDIFVSQLTVTINVAYPDASQLAVTLIAPDGRTFPLVSHPTVTVNNKANFTNTTFDDQANLSIGTSVAPFTGTFTPSTVNLSGPTTTTWLADRYHLNTDYYGRDIKGTWRLVVSASDPLQPLGSGQINSWSLNYTSLGGVYHNPDTVGGGTWTNVASNAYLITTPDFGSATQSDTLIRSLTSVVADWRYAIPDDINNPGGGTHPILYASGQGGVIRSIDDGKTWSPYPSLSTTTLTTTPTPPGTGGGLPVINVTSLTLAAGNIDPNTGRATPVLGDPNILLASTYGRGVFGITLAPEVLSGSLSLSPTDASDSGNSTPANNPSNVSPVDTLDHITNDTTPTLQGYSEQSAFGSVVYVTLYDVTDPANPIYIGGYNPADASTKTAANQTNAAGFFSIAVSAAHALSEGPHRIGVRATDQSGAAGGIALLAGSSRLPSPPAGQAPYSLVIDVTPPAILAAPDLQAASDSPLAGQPGYIPGTSDSDNVTNVTNPTFDVANVESLAKLELFRDGVLVATLLDVAGGTVAIQDPGPVPSGLHLYTIRQTDVAANAAPNVSAALSVTIDVTAPSATSAPDLQDASDTGDSNTDNLTGNNNPTFNVSGVEAGATLQLLRDGVVVATLTQTAGGTVAIQDPGPVADGTYTYSARQFDLAGNPAIAGLGLVVTIDATAPAAPSAPDLEDASDSGTNHTDNITNVKDPVFDVSGVEAGATLRLYRTNSLGVTTLVAALPQTTGGTLAIQDPGPVADGTYTYSTDQVDAAGNVSARSVGLVVSIGSGLPATLGAPDLQAASDSGRSSTDNVTSATIIHFPVFDVAGVSPNVTLTLFRNGTAVNSVTTAAGGTIAISDPQQPFNDGLYIYTVQQADAFGNVSAMSPGLLVTIDNAAPSAPNAPDLQAASDTGVSSTDNITNVNKPTFDILNVEAGATLQLLRNGTAVVTIVNAPGGTVAVQDTGPAGAGVPDGVYSYTAIQTDAAGNVSPIGGALQVTIRTLAPTVIPSVPDLQSTSDSGASNTDNITNLTAPLFDVNSAEAVVLVQLLRDGNVVATRSGPGTLTDPGPVPNGPHNYTAREVDLAGNIGPASAALVVTIDTVALAPSAPALQAASDSGTSSTDGVTNVNKPTFDVASAEAGATVRLLRNGVIVATRTGPGPIQDTGPGGAGVPDGAYVYTTQQVDLAGNTSPASGGTSVTIITVISAPGAPDLQAASDSGTSNTDNYTSVTHPIFDVAPAQAGATVQLLRDGVVVATRTGPGPIQDNGPNGAGVPDKTYTYTTRQVDAAGNVSAASAGLSVTIATSLPAPTVPPDLQAASDSPAPGQPGYVAGVSDTDNITNVNKPIFDLTASPGVTVQLLRNGTIVGSRVGSGPIQDNGPTGTGLTDGTYSYTAKLSDPAGNVSPVGPALLVTIDTTAPAGPAAPTLSTTVPDLDGTDSDGSDSGVKGDGITSVRTPTFNVTGLAGNTVQLLRKPSGAPNASYVVVGSVLLNGTTSGAITEPTALADGAYTYAVRAIDPAGNVGAIGTTLAVTIDATPPVSPTVTLDPSTDTGTKGDGITSSRRPTFVGVAEKGSSVRLYNANTGVLVGSTTASPLNGTFAITPTSDLPNGPLSLVSVATDLAGNVGGFSPLSKVSIVTPTGDYNGDGKADPATYRPGPASTWSLGTTPTTTAFGTTGDVPFQGDVDGDGKMDLILYRPSTSQFITLLSGSASATVTPFGAVGDLPSVADFDGDGKADVATYRQSTGQWFILQSTAGAKAVSFGGPGDQPIPADFDGDGKADLALYRPSTSQFLILQSTAGAKAVSFGAANLDKPVVADYDGDGKADIAVFRPTTAEWFLQQSTAGPKMTAFGAGNLDIPVPQDYDGDGKADLAVYRPTTSQFLILQSTSGPRVQTVGAPNDIPVAAPYDYRVRTSVRSFGGGGGGFDMAGSASSFAASAAPPASTPTTTAAAAATPVQRRRAAVAQRIQVLHERVAAKAASHGQHDAALDDLLGQGTHRIGRHRLS